jgi:hypothetical protein
MANVDELVGAARRDEPSSVVCAALDLLADAAKDPKLLVLDAHPVGFAHAKLAEFDGLTVRLHIWPDPPIDPQNPPWSVHRHAWPLTSYVIRGSVRNQLFSVLERKGGDHLLYEVGYDGGESVMRATSIRARCLPSTVEQVDEGERYTVPRDAFHCTIGGAAEPTVTIAVTGEPSGMPPLVVGTPTRQSEYRFKRRALSPDLAQVIFESVFS